MVNYKNAKIYKLIGGGKTYIGSTTQTLAQRKALHVCQTRLNRNNCVSRYLVNEPDLDIILIEQYPCDSKEELHSRERYWIENTECINKYIPTRTKKEWTELNKDKIRIQQKEWTELNKDKIKAYQKEWAELNKDKIRIQQKEWAELNKDKIRIQQKEWAELNKDKIRIQKKEWTELNKDKIIEYHKEYYKKNKDKLKTHQKEYREKKKLK
jgi:hypothetical protein